MPRQPLSYIADHLFEAGIGHVIVARFRSGDKVEAGVFLVDVCCLGVKDAFFFSGNQAEFEDFLAREQKTAPLTEHPASRGRKLVEDAIAYARDLGFDPHRDFKKAARVFGGIDPAECDETFTFGREGKPFFFDGPHLSPEKSRAIIEHLGRRCGAGNFNYLVSIPDPMEEDDMEEEDEEEEDDFPLLFLSDSASDSDEITPDLQDLAEETQAAYDDGFDEDIQRLDASKGNIARVVLDMAQEICSALPMKSVEGESALSVAMHVIITIFISANLSQEERDVLMNASTAHMRELFEAIENIPLPDLPAILIVGHRLIEPASADGGPRLLLAFQATSSEE